MWGPSCALAGTTLRDLLRKMVNLADVGGGYDPWEGQVMLRRTNPNLAGDSLWSGYRQSLLPK